MVRYREEFFPQQFCSRKKDFASDHHLPPPGFSKLKVGFSFVASAIGREGTHISPFVNLYFVHLFGRAAMFLVHLSKKVTG